MSDARGDFRHGAELWNRGLYWEAHEAWEGPWRAAGRHTPGGRFFQGLILLAAAALKHERGASGTARRLAARGARAIAGARRGAALRCGGLRGGGRELGRRQTARAAALRHFRPALATFLG